LSLVRVFITTYKNIHFQPYHQCLE